MEQPQQLVGWFLLQQKRQPDLGAEVYTVDGMDYKPGKPGGCILDDRISCRDAPADRPVDEFRLRKIEKSSKKPAGGIRGLLLRSSHRINQKCFDRMKEGYRWKNLRGNKKSRKN